MKIGDSSGSSRIQSNLLQQNCFVRDVTNKSVCSTPSVDTYPSLDEVTTDKGVELRYTEQPYHITPQYVDSFVDSSDYRRDPISAINNGVKRQNLGDITSAQRVLGMDMSQARSLYEQLKATFSKQESKKAEVPVASDGENNG